MKVLLVSANDRMGGAAIATHRLHTALRQAGIDSQMLVFRKVTADSTVHRLATHLNRWRRIPRRLGAVRQRLMLTRHPRTAESDYWSLNLFGYPIADAINSFGADVVNLHWVGDNFLPIGEVSKISAPIVWTLQDTWAFTGGCHYAGDCSRFQANCGDCPQLVSPGSADISWRVNRAKQRGWSSTSMTVVGTSHWLADCARSSTLMKDRRIEVIGNSVDAKTFKPLDRTVARRAFNLPADKQLILFGAIGGTSDRRKGFAYLRECLSKMEASQDREIVTFGGEQPAELRLPLPSHQIGALKDEVSLSLLYGACDVYVLPTLQEAFGNTLAEALASGTPCVTFDGSGAVDIVRHQRNGYAAKLRDSADLLRGIEWTLAQSWSREQLHNDAIRRFGAEQVAQQYIGLYQSLLGHGL